MKSDIVNRIYFEFEVEEALEIFSELPSKINEETFIGRFKIELENWLDNQGVFDE